MSSIAVYCSSSNHVSNIYKKEAKKLFPGVISMVDKLAKKNIIHANKAANLKSKLAKFVASL